MKALSAWVGCVRDGSPLYTRKPLKSNQIGYGRVLQSSNWGTGKSSNNPKFLWQTPCNSLVLTLLLGLGLKVSSLFGHVFCYHEIINIQSFFICSCTFIYFHSSAYLFLLRLNGIDLTMSPMKVVITRTQTLILNNW